MVKAKYLFWDMRSSHASLRMLLRPNIQMFTTVNTLPVTMCSWAESKALIPVYLLAGQRANLSNKKQFTAAQPGNREEEG